MLPYQNTFNTKCNVIFPKYLLQLREQCAGNDAAICHPPSNKFEAHGSSHQNDDDGGNIIIANPSEIVTRASTLSSDNMDGLNQNTAAASQPEEERFIKK